jgi:3-dehydroquinate dehydratase-1
MTEEHPSTPVITMSMSAAGVTSRLTGESFGSALTFGAAKKASAPGQIGVEDLNQVLDIIHRAV